MYMHMYMLIYVPCITSLGKDSQHDCARRQQDVVVYVM